MAKKKEEQPKIDQHMLALANYYKWRDRLLTLEPKQRARECGAWGYFYLFYYGVKGERPNELEWREKVYEKTAEWFEKHPEWGKPSFEIFIDMLNLRKEDGISKEVLAVVSRVQDRELQDIEETKEYEHGKQTNEEYINKVDYKPDDDINPADIFT